ncbi:uncharacterized protein LOC135806205 [Sycon ciliatum]|uniref:uncharacterized protein LOC135806205 n=1 Tax=Sycon ciliatum TaxID=27933 RepID=UPI0020ABC65E|eukprot:scpid63266/ scgid2385/ tRNA (guanine(37)-N1)-methyltransferase; M1G-methyltransferase; tRNA [GM37] methyltransferase; tRNA methyltransferase 5
MEFLLPSVKEAVKIMDGVKRLNLAAINRTVMVPALKVAKKNCQPALEKLRVERIPMARPAVVPSQDVCFILLPSAKDSSSLPSTAADLIAEGLAELSSTPVAVHTTHFHHSMLVNHLCGGMLEDNVRRVAMIGHIAHINLDKSAVPYAKLIGEIVLACHEHVRTVIRKTKPVDGLFRLNSYEVLAGEDDMSVKFEYIGCWFEFDYSKAFWNSRLNFEHMRIVAMLTKQDVFCDMFAGCGPFSLPAAKQHRVRVYANDWNSACADVLSDMAKLNKVEKYVSCFNMDGREFIRSLMRRITASHEELDEVEAETGKAWPMFTHVTMNLPHTAMDFLDVFVGILADSKELPLPMIHVYFFSIEGKEHDAIQQACDKLRVDNLGSEVSISCIRSVEPGISNYRLSFRLPAAAAHRSITVDSTESSQQCGAT